MNLYNNMTTDHNDHNVLIMLAQLVLHGAPGILLSLAEP